MRKYAKPRGYVGRGKARRHGEQHSARLPCPNMAIDALPQIFRDFDRGRRRHSEAPCRQLIDTCPFDIDRAAAVESCANHFFRQMEINASGYPRSEERRVGKECVSTCRFRWSPNYSKKNIQT